MTSPGRLLDFFSLEASEYLARLEGMATRQGMQSSEATQFAAAARGLRGSATMAKASGLSQSTVGRIWRAFGFKPHRADTLKLSEAATAYERHEVRTVRAVNERAGRRTLFRGE